jgi:hypothetical protein
MPERMTKLAKQEEDMSNQKFKPPQQAPKTLDLTALNECGGAENETEGAITVIGMGGCYFDMLAGVRKPGKGVLTFGEAVQTVIEQGMAYEMWQEYGAPAGVFEVWVESDNVLTLEPGETTGLKSVRFQTPSLENVVVQVVRRADEIADTVVLLNRKLDAVPSYGVKFVEEHPNEQAVMLRMKPVEEDQLSMWLGFGRPDLLRDLELEQDEVKPRRKGRSRGASAMAFWQSLFARPAWGITCAALVVCCVALFALSARYTDTPVIAGSSTTGATPAHMEIGDLALAEVSSSCETGESPLPVSGMDVAHVAHSTSGAEVKTTTDARTRQVERGAPHHAVATASRGNAPGGKHDVVADPASVPPTGKELVAEASVWESQRLRRLGGVRTVYLRLENGAPMEAGDAEALLKSMSGALKTAGITVLTNETEKERADGTMSVRFEPDATCFGAIFAIMRDREENFLWQAHADCRARPNGDHTAVFEDASMRLVGKLPVTSEIAPPTADKQEEAVLRAN